MKLESHFCSDGYEGDEMNCDVALLDGCPFI